MTTLLRSVLGARSLPSTINNSPLRILLPSRLSTGSCLTGARQLLQQHHQQQFRCIHSEKTKPYPPPPSTTPDVPDAATFLNKIGRNLVRHLPKFKDWDHLMSATPKQLKALGIEPPRDRRYLIMSRERFRGGLKPRVFKQGVKKDGGERRRKLVRALRNAEKNKERREKEESEKLFGRR